MIWPFNKLRTWLVNRRLRKSEVVRVATLSNMRSNINMGF